MSKPLVRFGDPEGAVIGYYADAYTGTIAAEKPGTISTSPPSSALGSAKHLQVELDGSFPEDWPVTDRATVRVNCSMGAGHRSDVKAMASLAQGLLQVHPGDAAVWGTRPLVGRSSVIVDPATKNLMVWFTFRVNMRPVPVSV